MKRKIAIITILIVAFIIVGTVFGYFQHRRVEQKEQEKQKKEEYLLSIKDDLYKKIEDNQKYNMKDGSAIYFKEGNRFIWYMDDSDHENYYYAGTYDVYQGKTAEQYILNDAENSDMTSEELDIYYSNGATSDLYQKGNLMCLVLHNERAVFEETNFDEKSDTNYIGFYSNGYYWAISMNNRENFEFYQPELFYIYK